MGMRKPSPGRDGLEVLGEQFCYHRTALVRDQAHRYLGVRFRRKDGLGAFPGVAAPDAADVEAGTDAGALEGGIAFLAAERPDVQEFLVFLLVIGGAGEHPAVGTGELHDIVVEARHGDLSVRADK